MTIMEAITKLDSLKSNVYSQADKVEWLSKLDGAVKRLIIDTHEGSEQVPFCGYTADTSLDTVLLVPSPFDDVYLRWMEAQIDYYNGETDRYNNAIILYNSLFEEYANFYNRTHSPKCAVSRFLF